MRFQILLMYISIYTDRYVDFPRVRLYHHNAQYTHDNPPFFPPFKWITLIVNVFQTSQSWILYY